MQRKISLLDPDIMSRCRYFHMTSRSFEGTTVAEPAHCHHHSHEGQDHGAQRIDPQEVATGTIWTCPMHPEIRRDGPGQCPICGMALEPLEPTLEEGPNPELIDMSRRFWISAFLSLPLAVLTFGAELFGWEPLPVRTSGHETYA